MSFQQKGFTLIELMVAIALGLIVVAAGTTLFISSQRSLSLQQAAGELQDNANFALNYLTKNLRIANLDAEDKQVLKLNTLGGGIIFGANNLTGVDNRYVSQSDGTSNVNLPSDQLTIQYKVQDDSNHYDCEGNQLAEGDQVVERYFLRLDKNKMTNENGQNALALACKATKASTPNLLAGEGQVIVKRADYFKVKLIIKENKNLQEVDLNQYKNHSNAQIVGLRIALLARSGQTIGNDIPQIHSFDIFDQEVELKESSYQSRYLRDVISQTVALRNAQGSIDQ